MRGNKKIVGLLVTVLLVGCGINTTVTTVPVVCQEVPEYSVVPFEVIEFIPVSFEGGWVLALSPNDVDKLEKNIIGLADRIKRKDVVINYYKGCIDRANSEAANGS